MRAASAADGFVRGIVAAACTGLWTKSRILHNRRMKSKAQFRLRIYRDEDVAMGPGKVALLEAIAEAGSLSAAARQIGMSYRRAWLLLDETNKAFKSPVVSTAAGGSHGGGTVLTPLGEEVIRRYRAIEDAARLAARADIAALTRLLAP